MGVMVECLCFGLLKLRRRDLEEGFIAIFQNTFSGLKTVLLMSLVRISVRAILFHLRMSLPMTLD
jgi:hypothetical protein